MEDKPILRYRTDEPGAARALTLAAAPVFYAARLGWPVFPVRGFTAWGDKIKWPLAESNGFHDATSDPEAVAKAFRPAHKRYGVGLATGDPLGLWVLDIDGEQGAASISALTARHGRLPETLTARTGGGGWHLFFRMPTDRDVRNTTSKVGPKIDTRGTGGYVILPPSPHPSGRAYGWMLDRGPGEIEPAHAPAWLLDLVAPLSPSLLDPSLPTASPNLSTRDKVPVVPAGGRVNREAEDWPAHAHAVASKQVRAVLEAREGERNATLHRAAFVLGRLAADGFLSEKPILEALTAAAEIVGLPNPEIARTLRSGYTAGRGGPTDAA